MSDKSEHRTVGDSAPKRAHGTHGKGNGTEERIDPTVTEPGHAEDNARGSAAWGSEGSGGSVIDKRPPENRHSSSPSPDEKP